MGINAKPFTLAQKLLKRIFHERPYVFSAQDLTQQIDIFEDALTRLSKNVGMIRDNWTVNVTLDKDTIDGANFRYQSEIHLLKENNALPAYVYFKGIRFDIPVGNLIKYAGDWSLSTYPVGYLVLVATRKVVTFSDSATIAGVTSTEFPTALPSSDAVQYSAERLSYVKALADVTLGTNEELIGILATIAPKDNGDVSVISTTTGIPPVTDVAITYTEAVIRVVVYNAVKASELLDLFKFEKGDAILKELGLIATNPIPQAFENNGSLNDAFALLKQYVTRKEKYSVVGFKTMKGLLTQTLAIVDNVSAALAAANITIEQLKKLVEIPVGAVIDWEGPLTMFDNTGAGLVNTPVANFQICNGNQGTTDRRGRYPVMAIAGIPSVNAPALQAAVDPVATGILAGEHPNYAIGQTGGEAAHKLTKEELPESKPELNTGWAIHSSTDGAGSALSDTPSNPDAVDYDTKDTTGATAFKNLGLGKRHNNLPPFYATIYIKRIK